MGDMNQLQPSAAFGLDQAGLQGILGIEVEMKTVKIMSVAAAVALTAAGAAQVQAQTLPPADGCVSVEYTGDLRGWYDEYYDPHYMVTNGCTRAIDISWRYNTVTDPKRFPREFDGVIRCSSLSQIILIPPGDRSSMSAGTLPDGWTSRIRYCIDYSEFEDVKRSGLSKFCYQEGQPGCPELGK